MDDDIQADSTAQPNQEEEIINDLDTLPSEDEILGGEETTTPKGEPDEKDTRIQKLERQLKTASRKYNKLTKDIEKLRDIQRKRPPASDRPLTEEEKKNKQADDYIDKRVEKKLEEQKAIQKEVEEAEIAALETEIEDVLLDNEDLSETQILDVLEDYAKRGIKVTPTQAAALVKDGYGKKKTPAKPKPKLPVSKRGSGKVDLKTKKSEETKGMTYHEKIAHITNKGKQALRNK